MKQDNNSDSGTHKELITRILVCGRIAYIHDEFTQAEHSLMDRIVAEHTNLSEDCNITTMHGRELPEPENRAAIEAFTWSMQERFNLRGLNFQTEFQSQNGFSFLIIYFSDATPFNIQPQGIDENDGTEPVPETVAKGEQENDSESSGDHGSPQSAESKPGNNPLGIEFKQEAYDLVERMEKMNAEKKSALFNVGDRVIIRMPLAGTSKPEKTGLQYEIIMDEGLTGTITAVNENEMLVIHWDPGKYRIYRDLDLATMKFLDNGTVQIDGFETNLHSGYLGKTEQSTSDNIEKLSVQEQPREVQPPTAENDSLNDFKHLKFIEEADTYSSAKEKISLKIPHDHSILLEKIITDSDEHSIKVHGKNKDECNEMAKKLLPDNISVIKETEYKKYRKFKKSTSAFTIDEAKQSALKYEEFVTILSVNLIEKGKPKMFGIIKNTDVYEADLEQDEAIEIFYKHPKAKIYIRTGSHIFPPESLFQYKDLPEILWGCTQLGWDTKAGIKLKLRGYALFYKVNIKKLLVTNSGDLNNKFNKYAEDLYYYGLMNFTVQAFFGKISFTEYEPVCYSLIDFYKNNLLSQINKIKNGEELTGLIRICKSLQIGKYFTFKKWEINVLEEAILGSFLPFEEFLTLKTFSELREFEDSVKIAKAYDIP